jgi:hypothetical protein
MDGWVSLQRKEGKESAATSSLEAMIKSKWVPVQWPEISETDYKQKNGSNLQEAAGCVETGAGSSP